VRAVPATFNVPLKWNKKPWVCDCGGVMEKNTPICTKCCCFTRNIHRRRVFSLSLGDWLDPEVPINWLIEMMQVILRCPDCDFLLLTKRPELFQARFKQIIPHESAFCARWRNGEAPPNIWLGVTVENQAMADKRIPELLKIPAKVRFLSVEPLLEPVDLIHWLSDFDSDNGIHSTKPDWCIVGGESGGNRRDCGVDAIVSVAEQCRAAGVPVFVKQDCAAKAGHQGRIPENIWRLKEFPTTPR
jgi:protein gp37